MENKKDMNKLIPMTDFVIEQTELLVKGCDGYKPTAYSNYINTTTRYAKFLKQKLELWMFIPCKLVDGVWVVLKEPDYYKNWEKAFHPKPATLKLKAYMEYQEAKECCLFEGFEIKDLKLDSGNKCVSKDDILHVFWQNAISKEFTLSKGISKIEDLVKYKLELTPTAIKQIGL